MFNANPVDSSLTNYVANTFLQTASVTLAGSLRRGRLPTIALCAFAAIQALVSTTILEGIKFIERKCGMDAETYKTIAVANYVISQVISIGLTYLVVHNLALIGFALLYDMNPPSISVYDAGSIFCIVAQSTLVTLFVKSVKDLFEGMNVPANLTKKFIFDYQPIFDINPQVVKAAGAA